MNKKVIILGGGVAGLSAAHELMERGFKVAVYEKGSVPGGKARSFPVPDSGTEGRMGWPAEHGFRFFPRYYRNLPDTMKRIPYAKNPRGVYDNLIQLPRLLLAPDGLGMEPTVTLARFPRSLADLVVLLNQVKALTAELSKEEIGLFALRMWQVFTSCEDRRRAELSAINWWDFLDADHQSYAYQELLVRGLSQALVAAQPKLANAYVLGDIIAADILALTIPGMSFDRVLNGPTNDAWIDPWLNHLTSNGVEYYFEHELVGLECSTAIDGALISHKGQISKVTGDYYIAALPVEVMRRILAQDVVPGENGPTYKGVLKADPTLSSILVLGKSVQWMNGIMYYLKPNLPIVRGHIWMPGTPWALTAISEPQLWPGVNMADRGDGQALGLLSVVISDWNSNGVLFDKPAKECTREEVSAEVWRQMKDSLNNGQVILRDEDLHSYYLDPAIKMPAQGLSVNEEPLFISALNTWYLQPEPYTNIPNLLLASDYVHNRIQLATMEGANEAARGAVNSILDDSGSCAPRCEVKKLLSPDPFLWYRMKDQERYDKGLPWTATPGWIADLIQHIYMWLYEVVVSVMQFFSSLTEN